MTYTYEVVLVDEDGYIREMFFGDAEATPTLLLHTDAEIKGFGDYPRLMKLWLQPSGDIARVLLYDTEQTDRVQFTVPGSRVVMLEQPQWAEA